MVLGRALVPLCLFIRLVEAGGPSERLRADAKHCDHSHDGPQGDEANEAHASLRQGAQGELELDGHPNPA